MRSNRFAVGVGITVFLATGCPQYSAATGVEGVDAAVLIPKLDGGQFWILDAGSDAGQPPDAEGGLPPQADAGQPPGADGGSTVRPGRVVQPVTGSGIVRGGGVTMNIVIGHGASPATATNGTASLERASIIKP